MRVFVPSRPVRATCSPCRSLPRGVARGGAPLQLPRTDRAGESPVHVVTGVRLTVGTTAPQDEAVPGAIVAIGRAVDIPGHRRSRIGGLPDLRQIPRVGWDPPAGGLLFHYEGAEAIEILPNPNTVQGVHHRLACGLP